MTYEPTTEDTKAAAALFKAHDRDYVQGGFGHVSAKVIDQWEQDGKLDLWFDASRLTVASCLTSPKSSKRVLDFAGTPCGVILPCDVHVTRIAWSKVSELHRFVDHMYNQYRPVRTVWVEDFIQHRDAYLEAGMEHVCTKIRSDSTMIGVFAYCPDNGSRFDKTWSGDYVTLEQLDLDVPLDLIDDLKAGMKREGIEWADHYSHYNVDHTWSAVTLRGYGGREDFIIKPEEMSKKWKSENKEKMEWQLEDTPMRPKLPEVEPLLDLVPGTHHRVRLMRLNHGSQLLRHADITDPDAGASEGKLLRIHIPVVTNPECEVRQWLLDGSEKVVNMAVGEAWYLDTRKPHAVKNGGEDDRVHLVIDVESGTELQQMLGIEPESKNMEEWL